MAASCHDRHALLRHLHRHRVAHHVAGEACRTGGSGHRRHAWGSSRLHRLLSEHGAGLHQRGDLRLRLVPARGVEALAPARDGLRVLGVEERGFLRDQAQRQVGLVAPVVGVLRPLFAEGKIHVLLHAIEGRLPVLLRRLDARGPGAHQARALLWRIRRLAIDDVFLVAGLLLIGGEHLHQAGGVVGGRVGVSHRIHRRRDPWPCWSYSHPPKFLLLSLAPLGVLGALPQRRERAFLRNVFRVWVGGCAIASSTDRDR